ncbi:hypothetical protein [Fibrella arboris]|uniref:hypothetical protein n=1 Tax=Fibrella arboris TaxID=3242486 RepID=UPI003521BE6A
MPTAFKWQEKVGDSYIGINLSTSRYCGDISERYNFSHLQLGWGAEVHVRRRLHERWCIMSETGVYYVRADQAYTKNAANHLSFSATNFSSVVSLRWDMLPVDDSNQRNIMYLFGGFGVTKMSPTTTLAGLSYSLPTFQTEGVAYNEWVGQLLYGVGFPISLTPSTQLSAQGRYSHVLSDYLDDVSARYVDKSASPDIEKQLADKRIANRLSPNPTTARRGNPEKNDGYFLFTLQLVYKF